MIKFENTEVTGWEAAIRGMRNPMNSWAKSDSGYGCNTDTCIYDEQEEEEYCRCQNFKYQIGENDLKLMRSLANAGTDHAKFARMINVNVDITAPLYWWKEFETYRAGVKRGDTDADLMDIEMNSCSTMHKIHEKEFTLDDFSHEKLKMWKSKNGGDLHSGMIYSLEKTIKDLNYCRSRYLETKDKQWWYQIIQLLPSSYNQRRTVQMSYQSVGNMYFARKKHKLDEWRKFCDFVEKLPYFKEIYLYGKKEKEIRAKWITQVGGGGFNEWVELKCSNCRWVLRQDEDFKKYKYCPFCGAKMED